MPMNTEHLGSDLTTHWVGSQHSFASPVHLRSTLAVAGATTLSGALNSASAISGGAIAGTTGTFSSSISVGTGGTPLNIISSRTVAVVGITFTGNKSTATTAAFTGAPASVTTDCPSFIVNPVSALSNGLTVRVEPTTVNNISLVYSNASSVDAVQVAHVLRVTMIRHG